MKPDSDSNTQAVVDGERKLAQLTVQVSSMRAMLVRLLQDVVAAETLLDRTQAAQLLEANERLVVAAMSSQVEAETASQALMQAAQSATQDALTGLPNRIALLDRFAQAVAGAKRHGTGFALLFVDLDDFKRLNDNYGHRFGDQMLQHVAERLVHSVREVDTVSRHGGDEFLILMSELTEPGASQAVARKLAAAIAEPAEVDGHVVTLTASVGVAVYPDDGEDAAILIARADAAMYEAKRLRPARPATPDGGAAAAPASPTGAQPTAALEHARSVDEVRSLVDLREANEKLLLAALGAQRLQELAEQAQQRQQAFLTAVSAELQNPQAPIRVAAAMLGKPAVDVTLLPRVRNLVQQQMMQISQLVEAVRLEGGGPVDTRSRIDAAAVVRAAVDAHAPVCAGRRQRFEAQIPTTPVHVLGNAPRLAQIVGNLLDNAGRYNHDGGTIRLSVVVDDSDMTLTVADDGIGITADMLPRLFEPFVQDPRVLGFNGVSPGVGLAVTRALVRSYGGKIVAHSGGANRGSEFVVTLPLEGNVLAPPLDGVDAR